MAKGVRRDGLVLKNHYETELVDMSTKRITGEEMAEQLSDFINSATYDEKQAFAQKVTSDHRFLQQETYSLFMSCIYQWAKAYENGRFDERNRTACTVSHQIINMIHEDQ